MCGIVGIVFSDPARRLESRALDGALGAIHHRGPDGEGRLVAPGIAGGMRRLSIIDLAGGDQPLYNEDRSVATLFNGEIYNYRELRQFCQARGHRFRTDSDTEVLVHLYEELGDGFVERLDGMFGFVVWDARRRRALVARDRWGVKPLYLARGAGGLGFASEVKALAALGLTRPRVDAAEVADFLRFLWYPEPGSAWEGVEKLPPGTFVAVEEGVAGAPRRYHRPSLRPTAPRRIEEAAEECHHLLRQAVRRQLVADVPVGAFLSGGLDSSLMVAHAVALGADVPGHTTGADAASSAGDPMGDDTAFATAVAQKLGLRHHVHTLRADVVDLLPRLIWHADDPVADPTMINTFLICQAARGESKVLLSGMGADEVAGGYRRHVAAHALGGFYALPRALRSRIAGAARALGPRLRIPGIPGLPLVRRAVKALGGLPAEPHGFAVGAFAQWTPDGWLRRLGLPLAGSRAQLDVVAERVDADVTDALGATQAFDVALYLPSHNLHYVDKMSMAASVEVRVPFLDNDLAAFLMTLPYGLRVAGTTAKATLRRAARGVVDDAIIDRPKTGFAAPIRGWLAGPLRPMLRDQLAPDQVRRRGLFDPAGVTAMLEAHDRGVEDLAYPLWALLSLELWCQAYVDRAPAAERQAVNG